MSGSLKSASLAAAMAVAALVASDIAASAQTLESDAPAYQARRVSRARHVDAYRPLTVNHDRVAGGYYAAPASTYNPYAGPAAIITGPIAFGATLASLPFRAVNSVFPAQGNSPLVVVGAPVHFAGQVVQAPFAIAQAPFGGPNPFGPVDY